MQSITCQLATVCKMSSKQAVQAKGASLPYPPTARMLLSLSVNCVHGIPSSVTARYPAWLPPAHVLITVLL